MTAPVDLVQHYFEVCNTGTTAEIAATFADDATIYDVNVAPVRGAAAIGDSWVAIREKWNGAHWQITTIAGDADRVLVEWTMTGSADGNEFTWAGIDAIEMEHGRITEIRQYWHFRGPVDSVPRR